MWKLNEPQEDCIVTDPTSLVKLIYLLYYLATTLIILKLLFRDICMHSNVTKI